MSNEKIISVIDELALGAEECANDYDYTGMARKAHARKAKALRVAIEKLRTHPDNQPNEPLTLEELQNMVGQPVWVESLGVDREISGRWTIVDAVSMEERTLYTRRDYTCRFYGVVWVAYRRPPREKQ